LRLEPLGVEDAGLVDALVCVRAEEIALRLQEIRGQPSRPVTVEIGQRGRRRGDSYAVLDSCRNHKTPFRLRSSDDSGKIPVEQKIVQIAVASVRVNDAVQELCANNAATAPDGGDVAQVELPFVGRASGPKKLHSLRIRDNFRRIKSVTHGVDKTITIAFERSTSRLRQNFGGGDALLFPR